MIVSDTDICIESVLKELLVLSAKIATPDHTQEDLIRRMILIKTLFNI